MGAIEFYTIYNWMRDELGLSGTELDCYAIIYNLSQSDNRYIAGIKRLMETLHKTEPSIIAALKSLTEKGLVTKEVVIANNAKRNYYKAIRPSDDLTKEILGTTLKNLSKPTLKNLRSNNINNNNINNNNKSVSNDTPKVTEFEDFYKLYPLKKSKAPAERSWNKLSEKDKQAAIQSLPAYISDCALNKRSFKHPSTFLNQRTWEDEFGVKPRIAFYDVIEGDSERKASFKKWMRNNFPEIENTALPLSYEDYMQLIQGENVENVTNALTEINSEIYKYRKSDIAQVVRAMLPNDEEEDYD